MKNSPLFAFLGGLAAGCITAVIINKKHNMHHHQKIKDLVNDTELKLHQIRTCMKEHIAQCKVEQGLPKQAQDEPQPQPQQN